MKTFVRVGACIAVAALTACGGHKATDVKPSVSPVIFGAKVDRSKLGVPVYPGAKANLAATVAYTGADAGVRATFTTRDDFSKVYEFYKSKLPADSEKMNTQSQDGSVAEFVVLGADGDTSVQIEGKRNLTDIVITHTGKQ